MHENPLLNLLSTKNFKEEITQAIIQLFNSGSDYFVNTEKVKAKTFNISGDDNVLVVLRGGMLEVYREESYSENIFSYAKESLLNNKEIYSSTVLIVNVEKVKVLSDESVFEILKAKGMGNLLESFNTNTKQYMKLFREMLQDKNIKEDITYSPYEVRCIQQFLKDKGFLKEIIISDNELMELSTQSFKSDLWADMRLTTDFMINVLTKNKVEESNKLIFNDCDNPIYMDRDRLVFICQNTSTVAVKSGDEYTYYGIAHGNTNAKKYSSLEDLIESINSGDNLLDNVVFKAKGGNVIFSDSAFQYVLELNLRFFKNWLEEEFDVVAEYPIDIYDYQYQLKYHQERYHYTEFEFVTHCLLTLGNGVNQADGRFYEPSVKFVQGYHDVVLKPRPEKFENMSYCYLLKTSMELNDDWKSAAQYMVDVLRRDRPKTTIFEGESYDNALEKIIEYWENKAQPKKKMKP